MTTEEMTQQIAEYFKTQPVLKAWLFGSFARGEEREDSDVDLLIRFDDNAHVGLFAHTRMVMDLERMLGREVDLVEDGTLKPYIVDEVKRDRKLIYERYVYDNASI